MIRSCHEAVRLMNRALEGPLPVRGRIALRMHLALCSACRAYHRQALALDRLFRGRREPPPDAGDGLSAEARERMRRALRGERPD